MAIALWLCPLGFSRNPGTTIDTTPLVNIAFVAFDPPSTAPADQSGLQSVVEVARFSSSEALLNSYVGYVEQPACSTYPCTMLLYSFCPYVTTDAPCLEGFGFIPNADFTGAVGTSYTATTSLTLSVNTSTVAGFTNQLCTGGGNGGPDASCSSPTAAAGGLIQITWQKNPSEALLSNSVATVVGNNVIPSGNMPTGTVEVLTSIDDSFSATATGSALGVSVADAVIGEITNPDNPLGPTASYLNFQEAVFEVVVPATSTANVAVHLPSEVAMRMGVSKPVVKRMQVLERKLLTAGLH